MMTERPIFVDTSYLIDLMNADDRYHGPAVEWARGLKDSPRVRLTTSAILVELGDALSKALVWQRFRPMFDSLRHDPRTQVVEADRGLFERALELRNTREDKDWGLTDCLSFVVMADHRSTEALSCDSHFVQAGFSAVLLA
jgi:hypothetical protein